MYTCKYPKLFSPITIGNTLFRSRLFASPTGLHCYESKAAGGAASVCIGDAVVDAELGMSNEYHIPLDDLGVWPQLKKLASDIKRHGAVAAIEMSHGGSGAGVSYARGHSIYGPVETDTASFIGEETKHTYEMTTEIMKRTIQKYAEAAAFAKRCGFGMITLHGGHGWLIHQFMSPTANTRSDEYGGSFENRMRFPLMVIAAVREAVGPGFPIEIRISGSECYEGGYDISYGVEIAKALDGKVDLIHVSAGSHEDPRVFTVTHPSMFLEDGVNVKYAAEIKKHVKHSKVATVGALSDPALLEEILVTGKADVVELARGLICDPDLPLKARTGKDDEIIHCMRCLTCFSSLMTEGYIVCALNPEIGNEADVQLIKTPARLKTVLVAGGGIGGMQAAISCAKNGHQVILCEKSDRLGGILRCEEKVPFKKHLHEYLEQQARIISHLGIDVRLDTEATPELAQSIGPDVIIAAFGSRPMIPDIKGIKRGKNTAGPNVLDAVELYETPEKAGKKLVILGGGLVGCELAIYMGDRGHSVTIMEMLPTLSDGGNILHGQAVGLELKRLGVELALGMSALEINEKGVAGENVEGAAKLFEADTVVYAVGMRPLREEADRLRFCAPEFYQIGDCSTPKNIAEATRRAHFAAFDLSRR